MTVVAAQTTILAPWPDAYPRHVGHWTVKSPSGWGAYDPTSGTIDRVNPAEDPALPALASAVERGELVGYRFGRRAVVSTGNAFLKIVRPKRLGDLVTTHRWLSDQRLSIETPTVVSVDPAGAVELTELGGTSLHQLIRRHGPGLELGWAVDRIALALAELHDLPTAGHRRVRAPDRAERWVETIRNSAPDVFPDLAAAAESLPPLPEVQSTVTHGDLHDKNIFLNRGRVGLIDLDGIAPGAPEDDVANLAVHLELRALQGSRSPAEAAELAARLIARYTERRPLNRERMAAVQAHTWLRLACIYRFRSTSRHLVPELVQRALGQS